MRTAWDDDEDEALDYLPHVDQVIYLRGIRRRMDYGTGIAGESAPISYAWLSQLVEVRSVPGSHTKASAGLNKESLRAVFARLERAGLIKRISEASGRGLVFQCLLAQWGNPSKKGATPEQPLNNPIGATRSFHGENSDLGDMSNPRATPCCSAMNNPIPESGIPEERTMSGKPDDAQISKPRSPPKNGALLAEACEVIDRLNALGGFKYEARDRKGMPTAGCKMAQERIKGHGKDAVLAVVERKCAEWPKGSDWHKYLRPSTLFNATKFSDYLGQVSEQPQQTNRGKRV